MSTELKPSGIKHINEDDIHIRISYRRWSIRKAIAGLISLGLSLILLCKFSYSSDLLQQPRVALASLFLFITAIWFFLIYKKITASETYLRISYFPFFWTIKKEKIRQLLTLNRKNIWMQPIYKVMVYTKRRNKFMLFQLTDPDSAKIVESKIMKKMKIDVFDQVDGQE